MNSIVVRHLKEKYNKDNAIKRLTYRGVPYTKSNQQSTNGSPSNS